MKHIASRDFSLKNSVVALGKFDGLHLGHRKIMERAVGFQKQGYAFVVFTFRYHPDNLLTNQETRMVYTEEEKIHMLNQYRPDVVISYPFTMETAAMKPDEFVKGILLGQLGVEIIIVGEDFRYGREREGDVNSLKRLAGECGYRVVVLEKETYQGKEISSTRIRRALVSGDLDSANRMLGTPYLIRGEVVYGERLGGRLFGTPTMNLMPGEGKLLPPNGVYASRTRLDGESYEGITNIGVKPTMQGSHAVTVETNLFHFTGNAYGKTIEVQFLQFIRPERRFFSIEALKEQMEKDKKVVMDRSYR